MSVSYAEATAPRTTTTGIGAIRTLPSHMDRFFSHVQADGDCWIWTSSLSSDGYAHFYLASRRGVRGHRWIYELLRAEIPDGLFLDHLCRRPACVNPWHLEPVTNRENVLRGMSPNAIACRTGQCPRGHSLADAYVGRSGRSGRRTCRPCQQTRYRAYLERKRAAA